MQLFSCLRVFSTGGGPFGPKKLKGSVIVGTTNISKSGCSARLLVASLMVAGVTAIQPAPAQAQNFFTALFGSLAAPPRPQQPIAPAYADPRGPFDTSRSYPQYEEQVRESRADGIPGTGVYCVRTCDGRYYPIARTGAGPQVSPAKMCNAMCPAAQTKVFNGSNIQYASAQDGTRYSDLDTAFAFREKVVPGCSCTGNGPGGLAQIDIESDPTLRAGDVVISPEGAKAFKGAGAFPYKTADFTPIENYSRISADMRRQLSGLEVNTTISATPVQKIEPTTRDETVSRPRQARRAAQAQVQPAAQPAGFPFRPW